MTTSPRTTRAIGYTRVSTEEQARTGVSIATQKDLLEQEAKRRGWSLEVVADEGLGGSTLERPMLKSALTRLDAGDFDVLLTVRLDRLTRSVAGLGGILEHSTRHGWDLVMLSPRIDTTDPAGRFTTSILACAAQYERELISQRTKEALAHRKRSGGSLGRARNVDAAVVARIKEQRTQGMSLRAIAGQLNIEGVPTAQGGAKWHASTVSAVIAMYAD